MEGEYTSIPVSPHTLLQLLTPFQNFSAQGTLSCTIVISSHSTSPAAQSNGTNAFSLIKEGAEEESAVEAIMRALGEGEQVTMVDYDPSLDRREDKEGRVRGMSVKEEPSDCAMDVIKDVIVKEEEDVDNMFAIMTEKPTNKKVKVTVVTGLCHYDM